ncbi:MAG: hypothetical protein NC337_15490 [Roseburia sp.]|nr:hypothetical protein [Roseburia sp.]
MKKYAVITALSIGFILSGCANTDEVEKQNGNTQLEAETLGSAPSENQPEAAAPDTSNTDVPAQTKISEEPLKYTEAVQNGPYGRLSITLPDGWDYEAFPMDSDSSILGMYGIRFYPMDVSDGYIEVTYIDRFGVCGTGLSEEETTLAGVPVNIGTYDNNAYWDFITFRGSYDGVVALTYFVDDWWDAYGGSVTDILDTVTFDPEIREGGAYVDSHGSEIEQIGLFFSLKNISPTGATMVFRQYDATAPTGTVQYGDAYTIQMEKDGVWQAVPTVIENYGFNLVAFTLAADETREQEIKWDWLYGALEPGSYRLVKSVMDFRDTGDFDEYTVYAYFILN